MRHTTENYCCGGGYGRTGANARRYAIRVEGSLDASRWADWFDGMTLRSESGTASGTETVIEGPVADQCALHGLLMKVRDLHLTLISVERLPPS